MSSDEREVIEDRIKELYAKLRMRLNAGLAHTSERAIQPQNEPDYIRIQGNIGALEWVLREFPDERHASSCICADCAGAEPTARND